MTISVISENLSPTYPMVLEKINSLLKTGNFTKNAYDSLTLFPPSNFGVFDG